MVCSSCRVKISHLSGERLASSGFVDPPWHSLYLEVRNVEIMGHPRLGFDEPKIEEATVAIMGSVRPRCINTYNTRARTLSVVVSDERSCCSPGRPSYLIGGRGAAFAGPNS